MKCQPSGILPTQANSTLSSLKKRAYDMATCFVCGDDYAQERKVLGYQVCLECGDDIAHERKFTVAPLNKSNYMLFTDISLLKQLNPKRTT